MKMLMLSLVLVCSYAEHAQAERYALLAGNSTAQGNYARLKYVENDITSLRDILHESCGFETQNIMTLYNATPADLKQAFQTLANRPDRAQDDLFLFYYSGHAEAAHLKMGSRVYPLDALRNDLVGFPSNVRIGIFDACQSGSFTRIKGGKLDEPFLFRDDGKTAGQVILSSSSINENAQESDALGGSVFTFYLVNALRGSADFSGDKKVTLSEAYQYAYDKTLANTAGTPGGTQHPSYQFRIHGEGDIVLSDLNRSTCGIILDNDLQGTITVINQSNRVMADCAKQRGRSVVLAMRPGTYRVLASREGDLFQTIVRVKNNNTTTVKTGDFSPVRTGEMAGSKKGERKHTIGAGVSCGFSLSPADFHRLEQGLESRFASYGSFGMSLELPFPVRMTGYLFQGEMGIREHYFLHISMTSLYYRASGEYTGAYTNQADNETYGAALAIDYSLVVSPIEFGAGYRFSKRYLENVKIEAGIAVFNTELNVKSWFNDSLYDTEVYGIGREAGFLVLPVAALVYSLPINRWLEGGIKVKGRYQIHSAILQNSAEEQNQGKDWGKISDPALRFDFGGVEANLFVTFRLR